MKRILYAIIIPLLLSCSSTKSMQQETREEVSTEILSRKNDSTSRKQQESVEKEIQLIKNMLRQIDISSNKVNYYPPDSTGKQYPMSRESTLINSREETHEQYNEDLRILKESLESFITQFQTFIYEEKNKETTVKENKLSWWDEFKMKHGIEILLAITVLIIGYLLYMKHKG